MLPRYYPKVAAMLTNAQPDLLAFAAFPRRHWSQIWSTNPLERVNKVIKRRTDVVGLFPNTAALLRLSGSVLIEQHDEWEAADRRYFSEASMLELAAITNPTEITNEAVVLRTHSRSNYRQLTRPVLRNSTTQRDATGSRRCPVTSRRSSSRPQNVVESPREPAEIDATATSGFPDGLCEKSYP